LADNTKQEKVIDKVKNFITLIDSNWRKYYLPNQHIVLDEGIVAFQGRCKYKLYNAMKPEKWGLRLYLLCDSSGYVWRAKVYKGKEDSQENYTTLLTLSFIEGLENRGHKLFIDDFYTSPTLLFELEKKGIALIGIVKPNRKSLPTTHKSLKLEPNQTKVYAKSHNLCIYFKDKEKPLILLSNAYPAFDSTRAEGKPLAIEKYNQYVHAIDQANQEREKSYYKYIHEELK